MLIDLVNLIPDRYFTGHSKNPDGSRQFWAGKTSAGDAADGVIKIITVAVCALLIRYSLYLYFFG